MLGRSVTFRSEYKRGGKVSSTKKKTYHDKTTLAKSERHPHSRLKTQKEYKAITDSPAYKKADYRTQNKMLKKHPTTMKRGGAVGKGTGGGGGTTTTTKKKEPGKIKKFFGKIRKKIIPTFGEQHETATKEGKKTFTSTRKKKRGSGWFGGERGKLHYATTKKADVEKKIAKSKAADAKIHSPHKSEKKPVYEKATGTKVSKRGQAFAAARKAGKKEFTFEGKKYHTRVKGEEKKQPGVKVDKKGITFKLPELSGGTAKKIKKRIGAQGGGRIADAARRAQTHGWYSPDMGMRGRDPRMGMRGGDPRMARGRGYAKGGLIKGKPKIAVRGW